MLCDPGEITRVSKLLARYGVHVGQRWARKRRELAEQLVATGRSELLTAAALDWRRRVDRAAGRLSLGAALLELLEDAEGWVECLEQFRESTEPKVRPRGENPLALAREAAARCEGLAIDEYLARCERDREALAYIEGDHLARFIAADPARKLEVARWCDDLLSRQPIDGCTTLAQLVALRDERARAQLERWNRAREAWRGAVALSAPEPAPLATAAPQANVGRSRGRRKGAR